MRYIIGIDLGTTNCGVAYVDTQDIRAPIQILPLPQLVASGQIENRQLLPSFCYLAKEEEWPKDTLKLPWTKQSDYFVGAFALDHGSRVPTRLVSSAKSWLCHSSIARKDPILPLSAEPSMRISPVEASSRYLRHIAEAWNWSIAKGNPEDEFDQQEIIITVPASFDEVARALTVESAKRAGFTTVTMLEEPQAAFYHWINQHAGKWSEYVAKGNRILICDVGGGTTDFSLIDVQETDHRLSFQRMAVGEHLLLGGENIDAALAHAVVDKLKIDVSSAQWSHLLHQARQAKEAIYGQQKSFYRLTLMGVGSKVVEKSISYRLEREEVDQVILDGFFGFYPWEEAIRLTSHSGMKTLGLPYEEEPSIIKHIARFLHRHEATGAQAPTHVLFNGGTMVPLEFQERVLTALHRWFPAIQPVKLEVTHFDHAVARGAAYYGKVRRGLGVRIGGGAPRAYYLGVLVKEEEKETLKALTLLARGSPEETTYIAPHTFMVHANTPVEFQLFTSSVRLHDQPGEWISIIEEELHQLPSIQTVLRVGKQDLKSAALPVRLGISLTTLGTLELWLESLNTNHRWSLEFQLRAATGQENTLQSIGQARRDETFTKDYVAQASSIVQELFTPGLDLPPQTLMEKLEAALGASRKEWPPSVLRELWSVLQKTAAQRTLSQEHEARWWNLVGFCLRPGYGYPLDDFRMKELWKIILGELKKNRPSEVALQQLICFRRVAGGLNRGQQLQVSSEILPYIFTSKGFTISKPPYLYQERLRTLASLEYIDSATKIKLGNALVDQIIKRQAHSIEWWALGRLGARQLLYGTVSHVIPAAQCSVWIEKILNKSDSLPQNLLESLCSSLARLTGYKEIDLPLSARQQIINTIDSAHVAELLTTVQPVSTVEKEQAFGESLPIGLQLLDQQ